MLASTRESGKNSPSKTLITIYQTARRHVRGSLSDQVRIPRKEANKFLSPVKLLFFPPCIFISFLDEINIHWRSDNGRSGRLSLSLHPPPPSATSVVARAKRWINDRSLFTGWVSQLFKILSPFIKVRNLVTTNYAKKWTKQVCMKYTCNKNVQITLVYRINYCHKAFK